MAGTIRKRGKESWELRIDIGRDPTSGKRRFRYQTVRGSKRQASEALTEVAHRRDTGTDVAPTRISVGEYLDRWLEDYASVNVAPATLGRYSQIVSRLKPALGAIRLQALRPAAIQSAYRLLLGEGLAARTVLHHHRVLREALRHAVRWQFIAQNPADGVTPPRPARTEMRTLNPEQVQYLLDACKDAQFKSIITVAVATGMRLGELLGLRWADIDLDGGTIHLARAAQYLPDAGVTFRTPKTPRSRRSVALSRDSIAALREHRRRQLEARLAGVEHYEVLDLVFATPAGHPLKPYNVSGAFSRLVKSTGLAPLRFHDLRHTAATLMLLADIHPKIVSERLGHATIAITLDTYSHVLPDMQRDAAEALDAVLATGRRPRPAADDSVDLPS